MTSENRKIRTTYRLTPVLDKVITEHAKNLGISKNAFVQLTLSKALRLQENNLKEVR
ncbi:MAG: toxin-antitoxin system HicB family antitoxin [Alkaliphilus sp.]